MLRAVVLDCFGVLYVDALDSACQHKLPTYGEMRERLSELNRMNDYGLLAQEDWLKEVSQLTGMPEDEVMSCLDRRYVRNQQLLDYAAQLRANGVKIGMLSNVSMSSIEQFFSEEERGQLFDAVVLSGAEMMTKPNPAIFTLMAERLVVPESDCVMIDDLEENCAGADAAGMQALQYTTNEALVRELERLLSSEEL